MKTSIRIFLFSVGTALIGFWPAGAGANAQTDRLVRCALASPRSLLGLAPGGAAARAAMIERTLKCLQGTSGEAPAAASAGAGGQFVTFDPPGSTFTSPQGITITGFYTDAKGVQHGFLRDPKGGFTTFDPPGSASTYVASISTNGEIVGTYCNTNGCAPNHGFVRTRDGTFTTFDSPPGTGGISSGIYSPFPPGINPAGAIAGTYFGASGEHGLLRDKNGAFTTIDAPGAAGGTEVLDINPSGVIIGDNPNNGTSFIRYPNGTFATIETGALACGPGSGPIGGINPAGVVSGGTFFDPTLTCSPLGFVRTPDGTVTTYSVQGRGFFSPTPGHQPCGGDHGVFLLRW
jgi:hypothetical protein